MTTPNAVTAPELARLLPKCDFREQHQRIVTGSPAEAYAAFRALTLRELPVSRALFAIRSFPSRFTGGIGLPISSRAPMVDLMLEAGFRLLADSPGTEIIVGVVEPVTRLGGEPGAAGPTYAIPTSADPTSAQPTSAQPTSAQPTSAQPSSAQPTSADRRPANPRPERAEAPGRRLEPGAVPDVAAAFTSYALPGAVKIAMTFRFTALDGGRTSVYTETRVLATDDAARRLFRAYWLAIHPFSALIRLEWLRAINRRTTSISVG